MEECWEKWEPISGLEKKYDIDCIEYEMNSCLKILFSEYRDQGKQATVTFRNGVYAYRDTHEGFRMHTINDLVDVYEAGFFGKWTFFKVTNSSYLKWLSTQSSNPSIPLCLMHFSFLAGNTILDIASTYEPIVQIID